MLAIFFSGMFAGLFLSVLFNAVRSSGYIRTKSYLFTRDQIISSLKSFKARCLKLSKEDLLLQDPDDLYDISEVTNITNNVQNIEIYKPKY